MAVQALNPSIKRMLHDKMYEKRKIAALEIEKIVRVYANQGSVKEISETVSVLANEFALSENPNSRKGGLIGLAACAIALGHQKIIPYLENLIKPVLVCSFDPDCRIRYFACESLYNVVKVSRTETLNYFNELFDAISKQQQLLAFAHSNGFVLLRLLACCGKHFAAFIQCPLQPELDSCCEISTDAKIKLLAIKLCADPDPNVRNGSELLDRLLKDIVSEKPVFEVSTFVVLLRDRLYTKNQYTRRFLVQWLNCVMAIPEIDILAFLPEFLEALFPILGDTSKEISNLCQATLGELLSRIGSNSTEVDFCNMTNIVIVHCQSQNPLIKETALVWMQKFIVLGGATILPLASGIITAVLPTLAYEEVASRSVGMTQASSKVICNKADEANRSLMQLITSDYDKKEQNNTSVSLPLVEMINVLSTFLNAKSVVTKCAVLRWIRHLLEQIPFSIFEIIADFFHAVLKMICDVADPVVLLSLRCIVGIVTSPAGPSIDQPVVGDSIQKVASDSSAYSLNVYFTKFIIEMLLLFRNDKNLLEVRCTFIIRHLCSFLNSIDVFRAIGKTLNDEEAFIRDPLFCAHAVKKLNSILMTSPVMADLRNTLKNETSEENSALFCCLYRSWCHSPVSAVSLCLLTQNYQHCCALLQKFSDFDLDVDILIEIDKLVNLLESPIFSYLRLQLLESPHRKYLVKTMYSLLMLLPQSRSFNTLNNRLSCVPNLTLLSNNREKNVDDGDHLKKVDFKELFRHFISVQEKHSALKENRRRNVSKSSQ